LILRRWHSTTRRIEMRDRTMKGVAAVVQRPYWSEADAQIIVAAWQRSGESQIGFAVRHGVDPKRLGRWVRRLARDVRDAAPRRPVPRSSMRFHPVRVVSGTDVTNEVGWRLAPEPTGAIEIMLADGSGVRVPPGCRGEDLERVLSALRARGTE
jgi:hypothetical protein